MYRHTDASFCIWKQYNVREPGEAFEKTNIKYTKGNIVSEYTRRVSGKIFAEVNCISYNNNIPRKMFLSYLLRDGIGISDTMQSKG